MKGAIEGEESYTEGTAMVEVGQMDTAKSTVQVTTVQVTTVQVTMELSQAVYERTMQTAGDRPLETLLADLIDRGLQVYEMERLWNQIAEGYNHRLAQAGTFNQMTDEVLAELAVLREQVADEFYPDWTGGDRYQ